MALIDTDKIAQQFGKQTANAIVLLATQGLEVFKQAEASTVKLLQTQDLVITIQLKDRVV
jgi:hypothetical protein